MSKLSKVGESLKKVIGITGGIATGKSTIDNIIKSLGYQVIDSDDISKRLSQKGGCVYEAIVANFGKEYLDSLGEIDRQKLGKLIFNDANAKELLNSISHPLIVEEIKKEVAISANEMIFVDIPLLFESQLAYLCDKIICVYVPQKIQLKRLMARDKITRDYAIAKINSQMDLEIKKDQSDYVISTLGDLAASKEQIINIINWY